MPNDTWLGHNELRRWYINRNNGYINSVFMDSSVRRIGLKQLWKFKWGKAFDTALGPTAWREWMAEFKDYDY